MAWRHGHAARAERGLKVRCGGAAGPTQVRGGAPPGSDARLMEDVAAAEMSKMYTLEEVGKHTPKDDCWLIIGSKVEGSKGDHHTCRAGCWRMKSS
ncbi:unnamed protein product [Urochloa humidicola]